MRDYRREIGQYAEIIERVNLTQQILKTQGLHTHSARHVAQVLASRPAATSRVERFTQGIHDYLQAQTQDLPEEQSFLATSDVIESLFGHYKRFTERGPLKEIGALVLTLPLCTVRLTTDYIKHALETISTADLARWARETLGPSALARRLAVFGKRGATKNVQEEFDAISG